MITQRLVLLIGVLAVAMGAAIAGAVLAPFYATPDYEEMRKHVISRLSDADIRLIQQEARRLFAEAQEADRLEAQRAWEEAAEIADQCADIAYRERHPDRCKPPGFVVPPIPRYRSVDQVYEQRLMGICPLIRTVREAKKVGCLP